MTAPLRLGAVFLAAGLLAVPVGAQRGVVWRAAVPDLLVLDVSADGSRVAVGSGVPGTFYPTRLQIRSAADGALVLDLGGDAPQNNFHPPDAVALDESGSTFVSTHSFYDGSTGGGGGLKDWRLWRASGELVSFNRASHFLIDVDLLGGRMAFANYGLNDVRVRDVATGSVLQTFLAGGDIQALAFSPDSTLLVTGARTTLDNGVVRFHPLGGGPPRSATFSNAVPLSLAFSADGAFVAVGSYSYYTPGARLLVVRTADAAIVLDVDIPYAGSVQADFTESGTYVVARISGTGDLLEVRRVSDGAVVLSEDLGPSRPYAGTTLDVRRVPGTGLMAYGKPDTLVVRRFDLPGGAVAAEAGPTDVALTVGPNPTSGASTLRLRVPDAQAVRVDVFDPLGRRVVRLHDGPLGAGEHALRVDSARLPPGVYTVRASGATWAETRRLTVIR